MITPRHQGAKAGIAWVLAIVLTGSLAGADPIDIYGAKALGMAGAGVGLPSDTESFRLNAASLGTAKGFRASTTVGGYYLEAGRFFDLYDRVSTAVPTSPFYYGDPYLAARLAKDIQDLSSRSRNFHFQTFKGLHLSYGHFGFEAARRDFGTILARADLTNLEALPPSEPTSIANNTTEVGGLGVKLQTYSFGYGTSITGLNLGIRLNWFQAETFHNQWSIFQNHKEDLKELATAALKGDSKKDGDWSVDLGAQLQVGEGGFLGVAWRNAFIPKFKLTDGRKWRLDNEVTVGFGYAALKQFMFDIDYDLLEHNPPLEDLPVRNIRVGLEGHPVPTLALRAGYFQNTARHDRTINFTGGIGFTTSMFMFDYGLIFTQTLELNTMVFSVTFLL